MNINGTTACYPGKSFDEATKHLQHSAEFYGPISTEHVQLCPQTQSIASLDMVAALQAKYPDTKFRLHANVRRQGKIELFDCSSNPETWKSYLTDIKTVNTALGSPDWSIHAGRSHVSQEVMYDNLARTQDFMGCRVAIEGLYPSRRTPWNMSTYEQYAELLERDCFFALDVSHVNIMKSQDTQNFNWIELVKNLMEHKNCIEIHISDNDGREDVHMRLDKKPWWWDTLQEAQLPEHCVVFTEGNQRR